MFLNKFYLNLNLGLISKGKKTNKEHSLAWAETQPSRPNSLSLPLSFSSLPVWADRRPRDPLQSARAPHSSPCRCCLGPACQLSSSSLRRASQRPRRRCFAAQLRTAPPRLVTPCTAQHSFSIALWPPPRVPPIPCAAVETASAAPPNHAARVRGSELDEGIQILGTPQRCTPPAHCSSMTSSWPPLFLLLYSLLFPVKAELAAGPHHGPPGRPFLACQPTSWMTRSLS